MKTKNVLLILAVTSLGFFSCKDDKNKKDAMQNNTETKMEDSNMNSNKDMDSNSDKSTEMNLAEITKGEQNLSTLNQAVKSAGMVAKLKSEGPFTVLAPNNAAFDKLPEGTLDKLLKPDNKSTMEDVLSYHIIPGNVDSTKLTALIKNNDNSYELVTANDGKLEASINDAGEVILTDGSGNKAKVVNADRKGKNGVLHTINAVLMRS